jgi:hypothetical protein
MHSKIYGRVYMVTLEALAKAALQRDSLHLRSLALDFIREHPELASIPRPAIDAQQILGTAAALLELFAQRSGQPAPAWTREIGAVPEPVFLLEAATHMKRLRALCESEAPEPLRKRGLYAPPDFLTFA